MILLDSPTYPKFPALVSGVLGATRIDFWFAIGNYQNDLHWILMDSDVLQLAQTQIRTCADGACSAQIPPRLPLSFGRTSAPRPRSWKNGRILPEWTMSTAYAKPCNWLGVRICSTSVVGDLWAWVCLEMGYIIMVYGN